MHFLRAVGGVHQSILLVMRMVGSIMKRAERASAVSECYVTNAYVSLHAQRQAIWVKLMPTCRLHMIARTQGQRKHASPRLLKGLMLPRQVACRLPPHRHA